MPTLTLIGDSAVSDAFYILNSLADATITASSATSLTMVTATFSFTIAGTGFALTNIGGKDYLSTGTISGIDLSESGNPYFSMTSLSIGANLFRNTILHEEDNTNIAGLENLFLRQVYTFTGTAGGDFQSVAQLSLDGVALLTTQDNTYNLFGGNDTITSGRGDDTLFGEAGNESINAGVGDDSVYGGADADTLSGQQGSDLLFGGTGIDSLYGGAGADTLNGDDDADRLYGGTDADYLTGGQGNDRLYGGTGGDVLSAEAGEDSVFGGNGADFMSGGDQRDILDGGIDNDTIYADAGNDLIKGGLGADMLFGGSGKDHIYGGAEADVLWGDDGRDLLDGGQGADAMHGGAGADRLIGGDGADQMYGDAAVDTFVFAVLSDMALGVTRDIIYDFTSGTDKLDFAGLGLTFVGAGPFTGANQLRYDAGLHMLQIDTDGGLVADLEIELQAGAVVVAGDLILV